MACERAITNRIIAYLAGRPNSQTLKLWGSAVQAGWPDIMHIEAGQAFFFEVKKDERQKASALQRTMIERLRAAGAVATVVYDVDKVAEVVQNTLRQG